MNHHCDKPLTEDWASFTSSQRQNHPAWLDWSWLRASFLQPCNNINHKPQNCLLISDRRSFHIDLLLIMLPLYRVDSFTAVITCALQNTWRGVSGLRGHVWSVCNSLNTTILIKVPLRLLPLWECLHWNHRNTLVSGEQHGLRRPSEEDRCTDWSLCGVEGRRMVVWHLIRLRLIPLWKD